MASITITQETNANIQASTRELWRRTVQRQVFLKNPMLARMLLANRITWNGGQRLLGPIDIAEGDSMIQYYGPNDPLTAASKTYLSLAEFNWKSFQLPVMYGQEEQLSTGKGRDTAIFDLRKFLVTKAHRAVRIAMVNQMYGCNSSQTRGTDGSLTSNDYDDQAAGTYSVNGDSELEFQAATQALTPDATYGGITRGPAASSLETGKYWQPASMAGTHTDWDTAATISPDLIEKMQDAVMEKAGDYTASDFLFVMGPALYRALRKYVTAHRMDTGRGLLANYGIESFTMQGWEIAKDYRLQDKYINGYANPASPTNASSGWVFCFCIPTWELRFHTERRFRFTGFTWQAMIAGGRDQYLARILGSGNFICWQPGVNMWLPSVS